MSKAEPIARPGEPPVILWHGIGGIAVSHGRSHTAAVDLAVSDEGKLSLTVLESFCSDDPEGPELVFSLGKAERLHALLGRAIRKARTNAASHAHNLP
jgi:hypothetical protein